MAVFEVLAFGLSEDARDVDAAERASEAAVGCVSRDADADLGGRPVVAPTLEFTFGEVVDGLSAVVGGPCRERDGV